VSAAAPAPVEVVTFGCRLNIVESEAMRRAASAAGQDNLVIVNTCAVTSEAVRQARQSIRRLKRERPEVRIAVTGCAAQSEPASFAAMPEVALVLGNADKAKVDTWAALSPAPDFGLAQSERVRVTDIMSLRETASHFQDGVEGYTRAFVQVQNGCDHRCTFCIIPFGRGNSRSVPMGQVVDEIAQLAARGFAEVVLTGVDVTSYGGDLPGKPRLGALLKQVLKHVPQLKRLRLSSLDCIEADDDLLDALANDARLMPHLHLSLQSGDDLILKRMKRRHSRADAVAFCAALRQARPGIVFGADFIAGFPTETEAQFQRTLDMVEDCGLTHLHVFPFSPRPGTPAARMPPVRGDVIKARAARLRARGAAALAAHLESQIGRVGEVLMERGGIGRFDDFTPVRVAGAEAGRLAHVRVSGRDGKGLAGAIA
jgi:threonylcarbamoyladenosine tRNA methylthiotransferase MtaB